MIINIGSYTASFHPTTIDLTDPANHFGEKHKDLFGEPYIFSLEENGVVLKSFTGRMHERDMHDIAQSWVNEFEHAKLDFSAYYMGIDVTIKRINLYPKKERTYFNDRFTKMLEECCSILCYMHPQASGYDINPVCKKFPLMFIWGNGPLKQRIAKAFTDAHKQ